MTLESSNNPHRINKKTKCKKKKKKKKKTCSYYFTKTHTKFSNKFPIFLESIVAKVLNIIQIHTPAIKH